MRRSASSIERRRVCDDIADDGDLALQPAVVDDEFADVLDDQREQMQQSLPQLGAIVRQQFEAEGKALYFRKQFFKCLEAVGVARGGGQRLRLCGQLRCFRELGRSFHGVGEQLLEFRQQFADPRNGGRCGRRGRRLRCGFGGGGDTIDQRDVLAGAPLGP
jgi:hypothetical protein